MIDVLCHNKQNPLWKNKHSQPTSGYHQVKQEKTVKRPSCYVKSRSSITAGALAHIKGPFTAYAGIGYGIRTLLWENYDQSYTKVLPSSVKGVEAEAGLMFKAGRLILTAGVSETGIKWMEGSFGIGLRF